MYLEVVSLRKTKTTFKWERDHLRLSLLRRRSGLRTSRVCTFKVPTATIWSTNMSKKVCRGGVYSRLCFFSRFSLDRNVYSIRHLTDTYLCIYMLLPYNHSVTRPNLVNTLACTKPTQLPDTNILILWFIKLYKYTSHIKFTMHLISTNKYFHLPLLHF